MISKTAKVLMSALITAVFVSAASADTLRLTGSGASFPFPLYSTWFKQFSRQSDGIVVDYQAKGSGAGVRDFINNTVDFAASDAAMTDAEISQVEQGVHLLPLVAGAVVLAYNLPDVRVLRLPRDVYPRIFSGEIRRWNHQDIAAANPGKSLPDLPISVVRRADSSGTTWALTRHLAAVSDSWRDRFGFGKTVQWPNTDKFIAAPKNDGVAATIKQTPGAIGYVEQAYAKFTGLPAAVLENRAGQWVSPTVESGMAALASETLPEDFRGWIDDPAGESSWPIVTYTWLLVYRDNEHPEKAQALRDLVTYCLDEGQRDAGRLGYIPLPDSTRRRVMGAVTAIR